MFCQKNDACFRFRGLGLCFEETLWNSTSINSCQAKTCRFYERSPKYQPQPKLHFHHQTLSLSLSVTLSTALKASLALSVCCQSPPFYHSTGTETNKEKGSLNTGTSESLKQPPARFNALHTANNDSRLLSAKSSLSLIDSMLG